MGQSVSFEVVRGTRFPDVAGLLAVGTRNRGNAGKTWGFVSVSAKSEMVHDEELDNHPGLLRLGQRHAQLVEAVDAVEGS